MSTGLFCKCFIESVFVSWYGSLTHKNKSSLQSVVKVCCKITHYILNNLHSLHIARSLKKAQLVLNLNRYRYSLPRCRTNRRKNCVAIGLLYVSVTYNCNVALVTCCLCSYCLVHHKLPLEDNKDYL